MHETSKAPSGPGAAVTVAIYTRVSTDNQVGGRFDSCESQLAICRDFILRNHGLGWTEVAHFTDPAVSGSSMNRPGLRALMRQIETGSVKVILIFKLERMSRNIDEFGPFRSFLKKHGCRLESATEDISENTPSGRLKNNLMLSFSQYEKENTVEKTQVKMHEQAKRGYWNGGAVPYGFAYDKNSQTLQPHPDEAPVVRRIYEQAAQLITLEQIADALNREGLRTRARLFRRTDGTEHTVGLRRFRSDALRRLVTNPVYRGVIRYAGKEYPGRHPALVAAELWDQANAVVAKAPRPLQVQRLDQDKHFNLLKGLVHCGCCQRALVPYASGIRGKSGRNYRYYYCSNLVKERADARCTVRRIAAGSLESAVVKFLGELGRHPDIVGAAVGSSQARRQTRLAAVKLELKEVDRGLAETNGRVRNCVEAIAAGGRQIADELAEEVAVLKDRKQEQVLRRQQLIQEAATCEGAGLDELRVRQAVERFGQVLQGLSPDEQKTLVGLFVQRVEVRPAKGHEVAPPFASVRHLELQLKLNLPRLIEGMEERLLIKGAAKPIPAQGLTITVQAALGQQGRSNQAVILKPFRCGDEQALLPAKTATATSVNTPRHPIHRARAWQRMLQQDRALSLRRLAAREGEVAPTLVRHFKLLQLAPEIQQYVSMLTDPQAVHHFSLRRLMPLAGLAVAEQLHVFAGMQADYRDANMACSPAADLQRAKAHGGVAQRP